MMRLFSKRSPASVKITLMLCFQGVVYSWIFSIFQSKVEANIVLGLYGYNLHINTPFFLPSMNAANRKGGYCHCHIRHDFISHHPSSVHLYRITVVFIHFEGLQGQFPLTSNWHCTKRFSSNRKKKEEAFKLVCLVWFIQSYRTQKTRGAADSAALDHRGQRNPQVTLVYQCMFHIKCKCPSSDRPVCHGLSLCCVSLSSQCQRAPSGSAPSEYAKASPAVEWAIVK